MVDADAEVEPVGVVEPHASTNPGRVKLAAAIPARLMNVLRVLRFMFSLLSLRRRDSG